MPTSYSQYSNLPVPDSGVVDDVPTVLSALVAVLDPKLVLYAASTAARDATYVNAPMGALVVVTDGVSVTGAYLKTSAPGTSTWATVYSSTLGTQDISLALSDGTQSNDSTTPLIRTADKATFHLNGVVSKASAASWLVGDVIGTIPSAITLLTSGYFYVKGSAGICSLQVRSSDAAVVVDTITGSPTWIGLWGITFLGSMS